MENTEIDMMVEEESRIRHILKHTVNDKTKRLHGIFKKPIKEILDNMDLQKAKKQRDEMMDIYCVKSENCGYEGGYNGDGHTLNYITIITCKDTKNIITMFPSDEIQLRERTKEREVEVR